MAVETALTKNQQVAAAQCCNHQNFLPTKLVETSVVDVDHMLQQVYQFEPENSTVFLVLPLARLRTS